jgi:NADPH:quinone reductase-like Zn-dependent oxidoreductase
MHFVFDIYVLSGNRIKYIWNSLVFMQITETAEKDLDVITELVQKRKIRPVIDRVYPVGRLSEAHS